MPAAPLLLLLLLQVLRRPGPDSNDVPGCPGRALQDRGPGAHAGNGLAGRGGSSHSQTQLNDL